MTKKTSTRPGAMDDAQKTLVEIAKLAADLSRTALNAIPTADKRGHAKDMLRAHNRIAEQLGLLRSEIAR